MANYSKNLNKDNKSNSGLRDLFKRIGFTLFILIICRIGVHVPLPMVRPEVVLELLQRNAGGLLGMLDMFSGGAIGNMAIMALGLMPYISSSIIVQLLTSVSPTLAALRKEGGEVGKRKITQYTRYGAVLIGVVQAFAVAKVLESATSMNGIPAVITPGLEFKLLTIITLVAGTLFLVWLGDRISERGIGNGTSMIIYAGIVANLPGSALRTIELGRIGAVSTLWIALILLCAALLVLFVVLFERAYRKVTVTYTRNNAGVGQSAMNASYMPMKLNVSGVIAPIFASAVLGVPQTLIQVFASNDSKLMMWLASIFTHGHPLFIVTYISLIMFFSFFYAPIVFNPQETADGMKKNGAFITGYRPGDATCDFFKTLLNRLTLIGGVYVAAVCVIPELVMSVVSLQFYFGGTSILIIVSVSIETVMQIRSHMVGAKYAALAERPWLKGSK
jgi:preprotein translocase subunit SecY